MNDDVSRSAGQRGHAEHVLADDSRTTSVLVLRWLLSYARRTGIDLGALLRDLRVAPGSIDDVDARVPEPTMRRAWDAIASATADEAFGLHLARHAEVGQFDVLDYAMIFSGTLREALERVARFYRLVSDNIAIQVVSGGGTTRIIRLVPGMHPFHEDAFFAVLVDRFRNFSGHLVRPRKVSLEHASHAQRELSAFFRCRVHFASARSELVFATSDLDRPVLAAMPRLAQVLDRYAVELVSRLPPPGSYADHVSEVIERLIQRGPPTLEAIARELHASPRTVQRRLSDVGTTYTRLIDRVRRRLAMRYLNSPRLSITEIAFLLGYEDDRSFRRAFKKWTGRSPSAARHD